MNFQLRDYDLEPYFGKFMILYEFCDRTQLYDN